jgi:TetR/AcrR family transcriptional repressor of nem operon
MSPSSSSPPSETVHSRERGRPREFDIDEVAVTAAKVFWEQGYHATSVESLCQATGLMRGSLYGAFGDKHGLLVAAFDHYAEAAAVRLRDRLQNSSSPRESLRHALMFYARLAAEPAGRHGCFITNAVIELLPADEELRPLIEKTLNRTVEQLVAAVLRGQAAGEFKADLDENSVGKFLLCMMQGLRVLGKVNVGDDDLTPIVELAMRALV